MVDPPAEKRAGFTSFDGNGVEFGQFVATDSFSLSTSSNGRPAKND